MSGRGLSVPPGRAGRIWLDRRLAVARRAADLLDRKLRLLQAELARRQEEAGLMAAEWDRCRLDAERWLLRASLLGGQRAIRLGTDGQYADIEVSYATTMGVRHPEDARCVIPPPVGWDGPVLAATRRAHHAALTAAVRYAASATALKLLTAETLATRHRLHALKDRLIPSLEQAMAEVTLAIEEQELADAARLRLAARSGGRGEPSGLPRARQGIWATIAPISLSVKARMVLVRTFPSEDSPSTAAPAASSSGNSATMTMSYSPSVYRCSRTFPPWFSISPRKASARLRVSRLFLTPSSVQFNRIT